MKLILLIGLCYLSLELVTSNPVNDHEHRLQGSELEEVGSNFQLKYPYSNSQNKISFSIFLNKYRHGL